MEGLIKGVRYELSETSMMYIEKRIQKLDFLKNYIIDFNLSISQEKNGFKVLINVHSKFGTSIIKTEHKKLYNAVDKGIKKLISKLKKDKQKIEEHK